MFGKEQPKYLTIKLDENKQKVYGLDKVNFQKPIYITEGPIDSLFIDNCLAAGGADLFLKNKILMKILHIYLITNLEIKR